MFRPGKNPKEQPHTEETADHTPQPSSYSSSGYSNAPATGGANATDAYQSGAHTPTTTRAVTESESLARDIKEGTLTGFVGNGTSLTGEAAFKGMLRVDGHLSGRVSSSDGTLIVSTNGQVDANVEVAVAQIYGTVNGDIIASKRIEMGRVAKVTGNIQTPALVIENGAIFEGSCRMAQLKENSEKQAKKEEASASSSPATASSASSASATSSAPASTSSAPASTSAATPASSSAPNTSAYNAAKGKTGSGADVAATTDVSK
jgi:cytoskeletal protein CcmA (bactofilin family)